MAQYELLLPKMGESVAEATVIKWVKQPGDAIDLDDTILEIATDKVDSEVPSPVAGKLVKQLFQENDVAQVGDVIAIIETQGANDIKVEESIPAPSTPEEKAESIPGIAQLPAENKLPQPDFSTSERFYSPLVKNIAAQENISFSELNAIKGSGADGRLNKDDLLSYIANKNGGQQAVKTETQKEPIENKSAAAPVVAAMPNKTSTTSVSGGDEIIEMDRMRKLIADHMVMSKTTSPHVTSFVEADVTNMVLWRNKVKNNFEKRENEKITFTPIFVEAVAKAIKDFPMINVSVSGTQIIKKRDINIGMAAALPSGNLIVPVIRNADQLNLVGLTKAVNDLALRARNSKLKPDETQGGTFTLTNVGSFGNVMGTPIINQPQVAILAVGAIKKKPAVLETEHGDVIAIRHMMFLSLSYDHRVVDGSLGGMFVRRVADYLENWDFNREI
ncbi:2-oxoglutarate dehydrogenase E2 component (dihydrolipoamide succinyltransferase) [Pedobacter psychrotolerans]|uniref:Dihydrolipoamide acetyltransferase component of pyruvate dehydrogenase complex n=1 Tax=Pedobacter psychrotolerans TaxID=1843235 RepID=A0A4R2HBS0_9SPHI|nr:dihydrolipoamide acetyltransferase family protein [Pedobacter psychrotolerans]TCO25059.1 2-oxoglutarate dehydrogenase E2 component (dihydrolipoamide succinyltransferase) [Pedobacter psychrotolerans]GGE48424.1 dihydrolipoamide acetyltransferase component of pyruvate dehydrogenase complex [Pedobacter psychrotolerans]